MFYFIKNPTFYVLILQFLIGSFTLIHQSELAEATGGSSSSLSASEITQLQSEIATSKDSLAARIKLARYYLETKQPQQTISYLRPVAEKLHTGGMRLLAKAYTQTNDSLQAIRVLQFLVSQNKNDYVSFARLGEAYFSANKIDQSITNYQKAIKINPRYQEAYELLLASLEKQNKRYDVKELLIDMIKLFGEKPDLLSKICRVYYEDGFLTEAFQYCKRSIEKAPSVPDNHVLLSLTYKDRGNKKRALAIVQSAAKRFPASEYAQYTAAQMNEENKNTGAAYNFFKRGTEADQSAFRSWLGLAKSAFDIRKYGESLAAFKRACKLNRTNTVQEFRNAASKLKKVNSQSPWASKFNAAALSCRYRA